MNIPLLNRLKDAKGVHVAIGMLGPDVLSVHRDLGILEAFGFEIERHPVLGAAYRGHSPRLCPDLIEHGLKTRRIGRQIAVWSRVSSTNDLAARAANSTANEGLVVLAEEQLAGRGRRGRSWVAPRGSSLLMSVLIFPKGPLDEPGWLTAIGAVAVADVVSRFTKAEAKIKWPNDVRVNGRKIAGILVERGAGVVIGIGLNVNLTLDEFPEALRDQVTSVQILNGHAVDRSELARELIVELDNLYGRCLEEGPGILAANWEARSEFVGQQVRILSPEVERRGLLVSVDPVAGVVLAKDGEPLEHLPAGTVSGILAGDGNPIS